MTKALIQNAKARCLDGAGLTRDEIVELLALEPNATECLELRRTAHEVAQIITKGTAYLWSAIGVDFAPCSMSCNFCSFGADWRLVKKPYIYSEVEILAQARHYIDNNVHFIVLRTTEFFAVETLLKLTRKIRKEFPGNYELILNTGDFKSETATEIHTAGVSGIYHALRLREGRDTRFNPIQRLETLSAVRKSSLKLIHLVEPIGPEHTNAEIADIFLNAMDYDVSISGAMARFPVKGTPLGKTAMLGSSRLAQIIAVLRLAGSYKVPDICVHPASYEAVTSGANVVVVEIGAIPRDRGFSNREWQRFDTDAAKSMLRKADYMIG